MMCCPPPVPAYLGVPGMRTSEAAWCELGCCGAIAADASPQEDKHLLEGMQHDRCFRAGGLPSVIKQGPGGEGFWRSIMR